MSGRKKAPRAVNASHQQPWSILHLESVHLSPTNCCNYSCIMCPHRKMQVPQGVLDWALFERVVKEVGELHSNQLSQLAKLHFSYDGEPFMNRNYLAMLEHLDANIRGLKVLVHTNGSLLTPEIADRLLRLRRNHYFIVISLDASHKELYESIHVGGDYNTVEANVGYLLNRKRDERIRNPYVVLQFIVMSQNSGDQNAFYWKWEPLLGPMRKAHDYTIWDGPDDANVAQVYWKKLTSWADHEVRSIFEGPRNSTVRTCFHPDNSPSDRRICASLWRTICIGSDGGVGFCIYHWETSGIFGNLRNGSLRELFEGPTAESLRRSFWNGRHEDLPVCGRCDQRDWWHDSELEFKLEGFYGRREQGHSG